MLDFGSRSCLLPPGDSALTCLPNKRPSRSGFPALSLNFPLFISSLVLSPLVTPALSLSLRSPVCRTRGLPGRSRCSRHREVSRQTPHRRPEPRPRPGLRALPRSSPGTSAGGRGARTGGGRGGLAWSEAVVSNDGRERKGESEKERGKRRKRGKLSAGKWEV